MELDELKTAWTELGHRLDKSDHQITELRRHHGILALRSRLRLMTYGQIAQLVVGLLLALWGGSTWADHWGTWHLVAYGVALHLYGFGLLAIAAAQLRRIAAIDYAGPVTGIQQAIVRLKRSRMRMERILLAFGGVGWVPALFLLLYHVGVDVWMSQPAFVLSNLAVGVAASVGLLWVAGRRPAWLEGSALRDLERELGDL